MQGVRASDRALTSYCMLHRLSLALVEDFRLLPYVLTKLDSFQTSRTARLKANVPALGSLLALLSLSPASRHSWSKMVTAPTNCPITSTCSPVLFKTQPLAMFEHPVCHVKLSCPLALFKLAVSDDICPQQLEDDEISKGPGSTMRISAPGTHRHLQSSTQRFGKPLVLVVILVLVPHMRTALSSMLQCTSQFHMQLQDIGSQKSRLLAAIPEASS